jgi:hypothetical protein
VTAELDPYRRAPPLARWSEVRFFAVDLANTIPIASWSYYGDLGKAFNIANRRYGLGFSTSHNHHTLANLIDDEDVRDELGGWSVPWHRLRDQNAMCRKKGFGPVFDEHDIGNVLMAQELREVGSQMMGASAPPGRIFYIDQKVRDEEWFAENLPEWV